MWKKIKSAQERKNTFRIKKELWIPVFVLMIGLVVLVNIGIRADSSQRDFIRSRAELNAVTYADHMKADIVRGIDITNTFEQIVISENGKISMFSKVAENMMADYIQSIQIAPDGVVTEIYPEAGNETGKIDLIHDKERGKISCYARDNDVITMQGPFSLKQGGTGIAVRNPVYLEQKNGERVLETFEKSAPGDYDMILMDVQMPVMNGYEATKAIRRSSHELAMTIPIIAMTANAFSEDIQHSLAAGMNAHVSKPVEMKVLEKTIRSIKSGGGATKYFKIVLNDITKVKADVIVNTANPNPICVSGTDLAIYEAAGTDQLFAERAGIGVCFCPKKCRPDSDHIKMLFNYTYIVTKKKRCRSNPEIGGIYVRSNFRRYYRKSI